VTESNVKQSVYFKQHILDEMNQEALRLDRTLIWIVRRCIRLSLAEVRALPVLKDESEHG
jgi:uncharacterized small protein (TIGR04563 family)